jgi:hypothetical protein
MCLTEHQRLHTGEKLEKNLTKLSARMKNLGKSRKNLREPSKRIHSNWKLKPNECRKILMETTSYCTIEDFYGSKKYLKPGAGGSHL